MHWRCGRWRTAKVDVAPPRELTLVAVQKRLGLLRQRERLGQLRPAIFQVWLYVQHQHERIYHRRERRFVGLRRRGRL